MCFLSHTQKYDIRAVALDNFGVEPSKRRVELGLCRDASIERVALLDRYGS